MSRILDLRDSITRYEELEGETETLTEDEREEMTALESLFADLRGYGGDEQWRGDWYPLTLIREDYFTEAMREMVEDLGDLPNGTPPYIVVDWEAMADNLRADYSEVEYDGDTYLYR